MDHDSGSLLRWELSPKREVHHKVIRPHIRRVQAKLNLRTDAGGNDILDKGENVFTGCPAVVLDPVNLGAGEPFHPVFPIRPFPMKENPGFRR